MRLAEAFQSARLFLGVTIGSCSSTRLTSVIAGRTRQVSLLPSDGIAVGGAILGILPLYFSEHDAGDEHVVPQVFANPRAGSSLRQLIRA